MFDHSILRVAAAATHFMIFASAAIVTGLVSFLLNVESFRGVNIVYQEVIAVITLGFYMVAMVLPFIGKYRGYLLPMNLVFTYLWLTSFIFAAQDWSSGRCSYNPPGEGRCSIKKATEAFDFLAFFFLLCNVVFEGLLWRASGKTQHAASSKERSESAVTATSALTEGDAAA